MFRTVFVLCVLLVGLVKVRKFSGRNRILWRYDYNVWWWYFL